MVKVVPLLGSLGRTGVSPLRRSDHAAVCRHMLVTVAAAHAAALDKAHLEQALPEATCQGLRSPASIGQLVVAHS